MPRDTSQWRFETKSVHAGYSPEATTHAVAVPIYQTAAYSFDSAQHGADLFDLKVAGNIYTRIMNPTQAVLEEWVAALEGGIAALAVASGQAAVTYAIQTIAEAGDNIVSSSALYGGTYNLFARTLPQYGINTRFADYRNPASFAPLIDANTKAIFVESLGNPSGNVTLHPRHSRYRPPARHRAHRRPAGRPGPGAGGGVTAQPAAPSTPGPAAALRVALETPDQPAVLALIAALDAYQASLYPPESCHALDLAALRRPGVLFAVARGWDGADGPVIGCAAIVLGPDFGELKRMVVQPAARGQGVAQALLDFLQQHALAQGCRQLMLETGPLQHAALALYARNGFVRCGPFAGYWDDPLSVFMHKTLVA